MDNDGHWHPLYSSGRDGIDDCGWFDKKVSGLKSDLGYDIRSPKMQYEERVHNAVQKVFGKKWYEIFPGEGEPQPEDDPRVIEMTKDDKAKLDEFNERFKEYKDELEHRLDYAFMESFKRDREDDRPSEIGMIDEAHIKETCKDFCDKYKGNVGFMVGILDRLANAGFDPWCTCTDCGEQFQLRDYDSFSSMLDRNAYTGDGGIGVIMKRVMCEDCMYESECQCCHENDMPNKNAIDHGKNDYRNYDFFASVVEDWLRVCWGCADGFFREYALKWEEDFRKYINTEIGDKYEEILESAKKTFGDFAEEGEHELYVVMRNTLKGRKMINEVRDLFSKPASEYEYFKDSMDLDQEWIDERLDESEVTQEQLAGLV